MLTREQAQAIYRAGEQTVVRVLLEMDARIHALEQQVRELIVRLDASEQRVKLLEDQLAKNSSQQQQAAFHRWVPEARAQEPAGKERAPLGRSARTCGANTRDGREARSYRAPPG